MFLYISEVLYLYCFIYFYIIIKVIFVIIFYNYIKFKLFLVTKNKYLFNSILCSLYVIKSSLYSPSFFQKKSVYGHTQKFPFINKFMESLNSVTEIETKIEYKAEVINIFCANALVDLQKAIETLRKL